MAEQRHLDVLLVSKRPGFRVTLLVTLIVRRMVCSCPTVVLVSSDLNYPYLRIVDRERVRHIVVVHGVLRRRIVWKAVFGRGDSHRSPLACLER